MSCLLRLSTPLQSNFKALFSSRNRLRALSDAILLLIGRSHVGHKNAYRLHSHGGACTLVAGTQDVVLTQTVAYCRSPERFWLKLFAEVLRTSECRHSGDGLTTMYIIINAT